MNNPFSIVHDKEEHTCTWCQSTFQSQEEGELLVYEKHCEVLCGTCLTKYVEGILKILENEKENTQTS